MSELKKIPKTDLILSDSKIVDLISQFGREEVVSVIRNIVMEIRNNIKKGDKCPDIDFFVKTVVDYFPQNPKLVSVINATGKVLHTNLGRAVLGKKVLKDISPVILGYSNIEYDLKLAKRGKRDDLLSGLICRITGAEDAIVVNNNAAAVMFILQCFAKNKEVIVSRGELIEIGGSFRIPDIMEQSGAKMIEVGTTNRTKYEDYENAVTENSAILFKAHQSNFFIKGFTEEVSLKDLDDIKNKYNTTLENKLISVYDVGSGLLVKPDRLRNLDEPDVKSAVLAGVDIVCFSGDKLLGGPQAGIIVGKKNLIEKLKKHPLKRALRIGKLTTAALLSAIRNYTDENLLRKNNHTFKLLSQNKEILEKKAKLLKIKLEKINLHAEIIFSEAIAGGGTLPHVKIDSVNVVIKNESLKKYDFTGEKLYLELHKQEIPVVSVLSNGTCQFNMFTLELEQIDVIIAFLENMFS